MRKNYFFSLTEDNNLRMNLEQQELAQLTASTVPRNLGHDRSIRAIRVQIFDSLAQRCLYDRILGIPVSGIQ